MRIAVVENEIVTNIILAEAANPAIGWIEIPDDSPVSIGWTYDGTDFAPPPPAPTPPGELTPVDQQILAAPDTLFGGPTLRETFDVHATGD